MDRNACKFRIFSFDHEVYMVPGFPPDIIGRLYFPEITRDDEPHYLAVIPGVEPVSNRRKAKRALNRYRKFRNRYAKMTGAQAPLHWEGVQ